MKKTYILPHIEALHLKPSQPLLIGSGLLEEETTEVWAPPIDFDSADDWDPATDSDLDQFEEEL